MPDTNPPVDDPAVVDYIIRRARDTAGVRLMPSAALTKGLHGKEMTEFGLLGQPVLYSLLMARVRLPMRK